MRTQAELLARHLAGKRKRAPKGFRQRHPRPIHLEMSPPPPEPGKRADGRPARNRHKNRIWHHERLTNGEKVRVANELYTENQLFPL